MADVAQCSLEDQDAALLPIQEDVAEWLSRLLGQELCQKTLFDDLQTGTLLCQAAHIICQNAKKLPAEELNSRLNNNTNYGATEESPSVRKYAKLINHSKSLEPPKYFAKAQPGSFLARDNAANFISWCRALGVQDTCMFESEGLVLQKQRREVLLCLMEVARFASRFGITPPELIHLEKDIEHEESKRQELFQSLGLKSDPLLVTPPTVNKKARTKVMELDSAVHRIIDNSVFRGLVDIERIGEGRYRIESKLVFIRMLRKRHVMVRVGGGWDTLEHYLLTHNSRCFTPKIRLLSVTDRQQENITTRKQRKFHQIRNRIPLRTKQC